MKFLICFLVLALAYNPVLAAEPTKATIDWSYLKELQAQATKLNLSSDRGWHLRNYYKGRTGGGYRSEIDGANFFLSVHGKDNPQAELLATLEAFFDPVTSVPDEHPQCRYISRRNFIFEKLKPDPSRLPRLDCPYYSKWKSRLDANAVSLIFASAYMNNSASLFGHTFIKFHTRGNEGDRDLLNYGVSYAASMNDGLPIFGLFGGYPGAFTLSPYHETLRSYVNLEGRDIFEYRLRFEQDELDRMLDHLLEIQQTYFDYYFFDENCAYQMLAVFEIGRSSLHLTDQYWYQVIPADTARLVANTPGLVETRTYRPSLNTQMEAQMAKTPWRQQMLAKNFLYWPSARVKESLQPLPIEEKVNTLDLALSYGAILEYKDLSRWREVNHSLRVERAKLGVQSPQLKLEQPAPVEDGSESNLWRSTLGERAGEPYLGLEWRPAYHDLVSSPVGYNAHSHLDIMRFRIQRSLKPEKPWILREATVLSMQSGSPANLFFQPMSWKAGFGFERADDEPDLETMLAHGRAGVGFTLGGKNWGLYNFIEGHADQSQAQFRLWPGVSSQFYLQIFRQVRLLASYEYRQSLGKYEKIYARSGGVVSWNPFKNLELRGEAWQYREYVDKSFSLLWFTAL